MRDIIHTGVIDARIDYWDWERRDVGLRYRGRPLRLNLTDERMREYPMGTEVEVMVVMRRREGGEQ